MLQIIVISLATQNGLVRRRNLNYPFSWLRGRSGWMVRGQIRIRMRRFYGEQRRHRNGRIGCFVSHNDGTAMGGSVALFPT